MEMVFDPREQTPLVIGATGMESIVQNIRMIILTLCCSIPLDRAFAHDGRLLDSPAPNATGRLSGELIEAIEKYEPRVNVRGLEFVYEDAQGQLMEGTLVPKVSFSLKEGVEL